MLKAGIVGMGHMGERHINSYKNIDNVEVNAVNDVRINELKKKFDLEGIKTYEKFENLLNDKDIDFVDICLPTFLHKEHTIRALDAGKHVICEKPMAMNVEECDAMIEAQKKSNKFLMIAQCIRFWPEYEILKDYVSQNKFGRLLSLYLLRACQTPSWSWNSWLTQGSKSGGAILDLHVHDVDMVNYLLGMPEAVYSVGANAIKGGGIDILSTQYLYDKDIVATVDCNWVVEGGFGFEMSYRACFEEGTIIFSSKHEPKIKLYPKDENEFTPELDKHTAYEKELSYFADCIEKGKEPEIITPKSARDTIKIVTAELKSIKSKEKVILKV
ncbi:MAG: Gfo/Idh/MocA family oxidoreductase [bacterium]